MTLQTALVQPVRRLLRSRLGRRFSRYTAASVVAAVVSYLVFTLMYGPLGLPSGAGLVAGFVAGLIPKYVMCRNWAWQRRGRSRIGREVIPYVSVSVAGLVFTYLLTEFLEDYIRALAQGRLEVFLMGVAFVFSQGLFFILKFVVFDQVIFGARRRPSGPGAGGGREHQPARP